MLQRLLECGSKDPFSRLDRSNIGGAGHRRRKMILGTGETLWMATPPFYVKHKALANLNSYVHFPVEIHLQLLFTTVIIVAERAKRV